MKNLLLLLLTVFLLNLTTNAQAPQLLNYQGVARNGFGNALPNRKMTLRLSILNGSNNGSVVYSETRTVTTNAGGLYTVLIGSGGTITSSGTIASINWQTDAKFLRVEVDPDAGSNFIDLGTTQLVSVPYAMSANIATPVGNAGGDLTGNYPNPSIANGAITTSKLADLAVTTLKLSDQSITTTKLADGSVTTGKLSEGSVTTSKLADANVTTAKLADASITDPKILTVSGSKVIGNITGNATNVTGTVAIANGGTGATTVAAAKTNLGLDNVDNTSDLNKPISTATQTALDLKENRTNKSNATTLGTSDDLYPTQKAVKTYVDGQIVSNATPDATTSIKGKIQLAGDLTGNAGAPEVAVAAITTNKIADAAVTTAKVADASVIDAKIVGISGSKVTGDIVGNAANVTGTVAIANGGTGATTATAARGNLGLGNVDNTSDLNKPISTVTQAALDLKENISNKSTAATLGTSDDLYPTQKAVKTYVDGLVSAGATPDATSSVKGKIQLAGDLTGNAGAPEVATAAIKTYKIADAAVTTAKINDASVTTTKLADGSVATVKIADASVTDAKIVTVAGSKVTGDIAGNASNVTGTVAIANGGTGATTATAARSNLGLGNVDNTSDQNKPISSATQAALDLKENLGNKSNATTLGTSDDLYPTQKAVKTYVDGQIVSNATPDATASVKGKIKLAGDLTGNAGAPEVAANAITTTKLADAAVTTAKVADASVTDTKIVGISGSKVSGNIVGNAANVTGTVAIANGGTGANTAAAAKTNLGLNNVDNTSDLSKPISTATQAALDLKETLSNKSNATTLGTSDDLYPTQKAVKTYVDGQVSAGATPDATANVKGKIKLAGDLTGDASAPEVAASAITTNKIADAAVTTAKINDASVTTSKLADAAITTVKVVDANITTAKLADASVTDVKIVGVSGSKVAGNITGNATNVTGTVAITNGGTGATTVAAAKTNLGLNNVDNTSDLNKPISTATQTALDLKAPINNPTFTGTVGGITKSMVGLGNVDNTSDLNKPISTATQTALDLKAPLNNPTFTGTFIASGITYPVSNGSNGQVLTTDGNGTASWTTPTTAVTTMGAIDATSNANGATINGATLTLTPADGTNGGIVTNGTQTFAGEKTFSKDLTVNGVAVGMGKNYIYNNTAVGNAALSSASNSGNDNTAIGQQALSVNTTGSHNTAVGSWSLIRNKTGTQLTAIGRGAGYSNTSGNYNSALGYSALFFNTTGSNNSTLGYWALGYNTTGNSNTGIGYETLKTNITGNNNTALGYQADVFSDNLQNATAIGNGAKVTSSNTIQLGNSSVTNVKTSGTITAGAVTYPKTDGTANQVLATNGSGVASWQTPTTAVTTVGSIAATSDANGATISGSTITLTPADATNGGIVTNGTQTFAGDKTFSKDLTVNGLTIGMGKNSTSNSTALGSEALKSNTTGYFNTATGASTLKANTTGTHNTALGGSALKSNTTGGYNTASGSSAMIQNLSGSYNTAIGNESLFWNTTGSYNTSTGSSALNYNETGIKNTANGSFAITSNTSGNYNSALGYSSLLNSTTGSYNTAIGKDALSTNTTGNHNTVIGNKADVGSNNLENATAIGDSAIVTSSNTIQLGNTNVTNVKTSGTITAGAVTYPKTDGTANQVLTTNGSGMASWQTPSSPQYAQILLQSTSDPSILTLGGISIRIQNNYLEMRRETNNDPYDFQIFASSFQNTTSNYNSGAFTTTKFGTSLVQTSLPGDWYKLIADETELVGNYYYKFEADLTTYNSFKSYKVKVLVNGNGQVVLRMEYYP